METAARTKQDVVKRLLGNRTDISALGVKKLGLFGSYARGDQSSDSDVDLLVEFRPDEKTFDNFMELSFLLEHILQRRVELITTESLSSYIGPRILEGAEYVFPAA